MTPEMNIVIYGASGHAASLSQWCTDAVLPQCGGKVAAFIDDGTGGQGLTLQGKPIVSFEEWRESYLDHLCIVSVSAPEVRRRLAERVIAAGGAFIRLHDAPLSGYPGVAIGAGSVVMAPAYVAPETTIGDHVQVMPMCSVGHDVVIKDFATICPGCTVSGYVVVEEEVFLGAGTTIVNGHPGAPLVVGKGALISAGSVVTKAVAPGAKVAGNPARSLRELAQRPLTAHDLSLLESS